ncbi:hypothetical protein COLO4_32483 [Corchorus olitorius]|uniref:F-box domain-containing protein n=1 Tax=Corchorus olitorius TaxID=93759 RepID=A0A1R3GZ67_9ROSI|nr:hypothetical protein COLO4_32483 [Corchorus olitorius]
MIEESNQVQPESSTNQETRFMSQAPIKRPRFMSQLQEPMSKEPQFSKKAEEIEETESMDIDALAVIERWSEPYFIRKVLKEGLGDDRNMHNLIAIAVHAVLLESGFVGFDPVSKLQIYRFPDDWHSSVPICYSLPELLRHDNKFGSNLTDYVVIKFQTVGKFVQVYGSLVNEGSGLHRLSLDEHRFAPTLELVWANCDENDNLCDRTGLTLPACLMRLPIELKLKIVESLRGVHIARMECVCKEMRNLMGNLASDNDLWKRKLEVISESLDLPVGYHIHRGLIILWMAGAIGAVRSLRSGNPNVVLFNKLLKSFFGFDTFFATDVRRFRDGEIFIGNLRRSIEEVIPILEKKLSDAAGREVVVWFMEERANDITKQASVVQHNSVCGSKEDVFVLKVSSPGAERILKVPDRSVQRYAYESLLYLRRRV